VHLRCSRLVHQALRAPAVVDARELHGMLACLGAGRRDRPPALLGQAWWAGPGSKLGAV